MKLGTNTILLNFALTVYSLTSFVFLWQHGARETLPRQQSLDRASWSIKLTLPLLSRLRTSTHTHTHTTPRPVRFHTLIHKYKNNFIWKLCINTACESHVGVCHTSFPSLQGCNAKPHLLRLAVAMVTGLWRHTPRQYVWRFPLLPKGSVQSYLSDYQDFTRNADVRDSG